MRAAMAYEKNVREFHAGLREWYYPKLFKYEDFDSGFAIEEVPDFDPENETGVKNDL